MFYLYTLVFTLYSILLYIIFRGGIYDYLRLSKISKTYIRKKRKGIKNYWFYSEIHQEHPLGAIYFLNIAFLFLLLSFSIISIFFGYLDFLKIPTIIIAILLLLIEIPTSIWASRIDAMSEYGKPFVLFAKRKESKSYYSSIFYCSSWIVSGILLLLCIKDIFGT